MIGGRASLLASGGVCGKNGIPYFLKALAVLSIKLG